MTKAEKILLMLIILVALCLPLFFFKRYRRRYHRSREFDDIYGNISYALCAEGIVFFIAGLMVL